MGASRLGSATAQSCCWPGPQFGVGQQPGWVVQGPDPNSQGWPQCVCPCTTCACAGKASKEAGSSSGPESQFIRGVIALHDKYIEYVQVGIAA